jgi:uncharacterized protein YodC (DUF2158 family)
MAISLKPGTVVRLKSGGPPMTVIGEKMLPLGAGGSGRVDCEWFEKNKPMRGDFAETSLEVDDDRSSFNVMSGN